LLTKLPFPLANSLHLVCHIRTDTTCRYFKPYSSRKMRDNTGYLTPGEFEIQWQAQQPTPESIH
jgi:hypothetical protein